MMERKNVSVLRRENDRDCRLSFDDTAVKAAIVCQALIHMHMHMQPSHAPEISWKDVSDYIQQAFPTEISPEDCKKAWTYAVDAVSMR